MTEPRTYQTYRHYKGGLYFKLCDTLHTETDEMMTVYVCAVRGAVFTRPTAMFEETVTDGAYHGPRFIPVPNGLTKDQAKEYLMNGGADVRAVA
jgi:hypothetical protein